MRRLGLVTHGITASGEGVTRRGYDTLGHRAATRRHGNAQRRDVTAQAGADAHSGGTARLDSDSRGHSGPPHSGGIAAQSDGSARHRRAKRRLCNVLRGGGSARRCSATAQHSLDCPTQRRLCNQWLRQCAAGQRRGVLGDAKQGHGYAANGQQGHGRALHSYGLAKMALQRQGKAMRYGATATQSTAMATHRFAIRSDSKVKYGTAAHDASDTEQSATE